MNKNNLYGALAGLLLCAPLAGCQGEKDLIIIDDVLPIKTDKLYMVGDATPNGWSIDSPTELTPSDSDPLVFAWEGKLNSGEMKLCLTTGSWDAPFIRPVTGHEEITKTGCNNETFAMHAGDPDDKWVIKDAGIYSLSFNLRNWTMSAEFLRDPDAPVAEPVQTDELYLVGDATPNGWNIDAPTQLVKKSDYIFVYEGELNNGEFKACTSTGSWDVPFIRPESNGVKVSNSGIESENFVYTASPDDKWVVTEPGIYRLTFDLEHCTLKVEFTGEYHPLQKLYMIGDSTAGGWSLDNATAIEMQSDGVYVWTGTLQCGELKACFTLDFSAEFFRPASAGIEIGENGVGSSDMVFTKDPDDKWIVVKEGEYELTFDTKTMKFNAKYIK